MSLLWNQIKTGTIGLNSQRYNKEEMNAIINDMLAETSVPYRIDALIIICFKALGVWYADAILIANQLELLFPYLSRENSVVEYGYNYYNNYIGHTFRVSEFLLRQVKHCFILHPQLFEPVYLPNTDNFPHSLCLKNIRQNCDFLLKTPSAENEILCFLDSIVDVVCNNDLANLSTAEIRRSLLKN